MNEKCAVCYTCEKGVLKTVTAEDFAEAKKKGQIPKEWFVGQEQQRFQMNYFMFLTNECNLRCSYCYATKTPRTMSGSTIEQVKKFIGQYENFRLQSPRDVHIQFFGGEPMMEWEKLRRFVEEFSPLYQNLNGQKIHWGMTTNGTFLTRERMEFLKKYDFKILLSIDGRRETHNTHRLRVDGSGSFDDIPLDLIKEFYPNCEIRPTITPETVGDWYDDLMWFHSHGFYTVATEIAYEREWDDAALAQARRLFEKLGDKYVEMRKSGEKFWMKFIDDCRNSIGSLKKTGQVCGTANNSLAIDAEGYLYACQRYASMSDTSLAIGDVYHGLDIEKLVKTQELKREMMRPAPGSGFSCDDCVALWCCHGGCNAMNYQVCKDREMIPANHCIFHRMWAEIALKALARTGELWRPPAARNACGKH